MAVFHENQGLRNQLSKLQMKVISLTREKQDLGTEIVTLIRENQKLRDDNNDLRLKNTMNTVRSRVTTEPIYRRHETRFTEERTELRKTNAYHPETDERTSYCCPKPRIAKSTYQGENGTGRGNSESNVLKPRTKW